MSGPELLGGIVQLLNAIAWPLVALAAGLVFKKEIRALLGRVRKGAGVEFDPVPQFESVAGPLLPAAAASLTSTLPLPKTPATGMWEQTVRKYPPLAQLTDPNQREDALVLIAARALLVLQFERVDASIWASQLALLNHLNSKPIGEALTALRQYFYEPAAKAFPEWYTNYPFEGYIGFLLRNGLIEQVGDSARITQQGVEYLTWRLEQHKPPKMGG